MCTDRSAHAASAREPSADVYRVVAVLVVVVGHWLVSAVTYRDGQFGNDFPLDVMPWTRWLTLVFQVVPAFFLVGGYANGASWARWCESRDRHWLTWARRRLAVMLGPTTVYVLLAFAGMAALAGVGIPHEALSFGGWAVAMHLWFVPVYLVVVTLTPVAVAAHRRWGLLVPAVLAGAVVVVDGAARVAHLPALETANYVLCWGAIYQAGICWRGGALSGRRPWLIAAAGAVVLAILLGLRWYPVSMVGSPGATEQNNFPPTTALLAYAAVQVALLIAAAPTVTRWIRGSRWQRPLAVANKNVMAVYLWQMVPVVVVALAGYPTGLLPQPEVGTGGWWLFRLVWLLILALVMTVQVTLLWLGRSIFNRPLPAIVIPLPRWSAPGLLIAGVAMATFVLWRLAVEGFAPKGQFPVIYAVLYLAAVVLLSLLPSQQHPETAAAQPDTPRRTRRTT
jgi:surface polysaccharide O-acyltransferase-like enzyme